tara:strand:- start:77 stop:520 length:444 start_codon:yes stop_codon:yes gene_type:complete
VSFLFFVSGHFLAALLFYVNHRFIFHTKFGNKKYIRGWKRVHTLHHKHDYKQGWQRYATIPWQGWVGFIIIAALIGYGSNFYFGIGLLSYVIAYEVVHYLIHKNPQSAYLAKFHWNHHRKDPHANFATIYTFLDKIFGTYEKKDLKT